MPNPVNRRLAARIQRVEPRGVILRQLVAVITNHAFFVEENDGRRAEYPISFGNLRVGVAHNVVFDAEILDAFIDARRAFADVDA